MGVAVRAVDELLLNLGATAGTDLGLLDRLEQRFLLQCVLVGFREGLAWSDQEVDDQTGKGQDGDHQRRQDLHDDVPGACADVAEGPEDHA